MSARFSLTVENALLTVLAVGLASFVVLHSLALLEASGEQTRAMIRELWFLGLAAVLILVVLSWFYRHWSSSTDAIRD